MQTCSPPQTHITIHTSLSLSLVSTMQASRSFNQAFLKNMMLGLQMSRLGCKNKSIQERKKVIKLTANVAMAAARGGTKWTRALITGLCKEEKSKSLAMCILGQDFERFTRPCYYNHTWKDTTRTKILRRSFMGCSRVRKGLGSSRGGVEASVLARGLVRKRTQVLQRLVPGGESLHGVALLEESLDYVISLQAQVSLMQHLMGALEASNFRSQTEG